MHRESPAQGEEIDGLARQRADRIAAAPGAGATTKGVRLTAKAKRWRASRAHRPALGQVDVSGCDRRIANTGHLKPVSVDADKDRESRARAKPWSIGSLPGCGGQSGLLGLACVLALGLAVAWGTSNPAMAAAACANEAVRIQQNSTFLPECRAYELVSPADKGMGTVYGGPDFNEPATAQAARDGGGIAYVANAAFPGADSPSASLITSYVSTRTPLRWLTRGISLPMIPNVGVWHSAVLALSDDLSKALVSSSTDLETGAPSPRGLMGSVYWRNLDSGVSQLVNKDALSGSQQYNTIIIGQTADLRKVVFETSAVLVPGAPSAGSKVYLYDAASDSLSLVSRLPNGNGTAGAFGALGGVTSQTNKISADGSVLYFKTTSSTSPLYRRAGGQTVPIDVPENTTEAVTVGGAQFRNASSDGSRVFFVSTKKLVNADTNTGGDLYLWEKQSDEEETQTVTVSATGGTFTLSYGGVTTAPIAFDASAADVASALTSLASIGAENVVVTGGPGNAAGSSPYSVTFTGPFAGINVERMTASGAALTGGTATVSVATSDPVSTLTLISDDAEVTDGDGCGMSTAAASTTGGGVLATSEDGHRVYFLCPGQLVAGEQTGTTPPLKLYLWDDTGGSPQLRYLAAMAPEPTPLPSAWSLSTGMEMAKVTADGSRLLFLSSTPGLTTDDNGGFRQAYLFALDPPPGQAAMTCVSCVPGKQASGQVLLQEDPAKTSPEVLSRRNLSEDGSRVFFETDEPLLPGDANGHRDVYMWKDGELNRITKGDHNSSFADASADGHQVFFFTAESVVNADKDEVLDVYAATVGGGWVEPEPSRPCAGDACQDPPARMPAPSSFGSGSFSGPANPPVARRRSRRKACRRGTRSTTPTANHPRTWKKPKGTWRCGTSHRRGKRKGSGR